jgi:hypothetical protein
MDEWKVRILHISDLHERGPREAEPLRRRRVLGMPGSATSMCFWRMGHRGGPMALQECYPAKSQIVGRPGSLKHRSR